jgi:glutamate racemase
MKAGSYGQAISFLKEAKRRNLKTMLGCMIETSLGISCALNLYELVDYFDLDGSLLIKNDPYNLILEENGFIS